MGNLLSKSQIWAADDLMTEDIDVPEWGGAIRIRTLTGEHAVRFALMNEDERKNLMPQLLALSAINEDGTLLFDGQEDVDQLLRKSMRPLMRLLNAINTINKFSDEQRQESKNDSGGTA